MIPLEYALEKLDYFFSKNRMDGWQVVRAKVRALTRAYAEKWHDDIDKYEVTGVELLGLAPLRSLENDHDSGYLASGKIDVTVQEKGGRQQALLIDHKWLKWEFDDNTVDHLLLNGQPLQYAYLMWARGQAIQGAVWDIIRKSQHRIRQESSRIVRAAREEKVAARGWTDPVSGAKYIKGDTIPAMVEQRGSTPAETIEEFEERIYQIYKEAPDKYFARHRVPVLKNNLAEHVMDTYDWTMRLDAASKASRIIKNTDRCMDYGRPCQYLGLCTGKSSIDDGTWTYKKQVHAELELPEGVDPHKVVTNSRLKEFRACELKHHRKYNLGLIKIKQDDAEELYTGTAGHVALEWLFRGIAIKQGHAL